MNRRSFIGSVIATLAGVASGVVSLFRPTPIEEKFTLEMVDDMVASAMPMQAPIRPDADGNYFFIIHPAYVPSARFRATHTKDEYYAEIADRFLDAWGYP